MLHDCLRNWFLVHSLLIFSLSSCSPKNSSQLKESPYYDHGIPFNYVQAPTDFKKNEILPFLSNKELRSLFEDRTVWFNFGYTSVDSKHFAIVSARKLNPPSPAKTKNVIESESIDLNHYLIGFESNSNKVALLHQIPYVHVSAIAENKIDSPLCKKGDILVLGLKRFTYKNAIDQKLRPGIENLYLAETAPTLGCYSINSSSFSDVLNFESHPITAFGGLIALADGRILFSASTFESSTKTQTQAVPDQYKTLYTLDLTSKKIKELPNPKLPEQVVPYYNLLNYADGILGVNSQHILVFCAFKNKKIKIGGCKPVNTRNYRIGGIAFSSDDTLYFGTLIQRDQEKVISGKILKTQKLDQPFEIIAEGFHTVQGLLIEPGNLIAIEFAPFSRSSNHIYKINLNQ
jgi:hypothetical protein